MKRRAAWYASSVVFPPGTRAAVEELLGDKAEKFLRAIGPAAYEYGQMAEAEVSRSELKDWKAEIEQLGGIAATAAEMMRALDPDCRGLLEQFFVLDSHERNALASAQIALEQIQRVCARTASSPTFNPKGGSPPDLDKRRLARVCAEAYRTATGKAPSKSPEGTFARVLLPVLKAVQAVPDSQTSVSKEFLLSVLPIP